MAKKILVVEDEQELLQLIKLRLESAGHEVIPVGNGQEAFQAIRRRVPDLIITDVLMPQMDGFTFYKELRKRPETWDIPVLIMTARRQMEASFQAVGVSDFISKPFEEGVLLSKVDTLLNRSRLQKPRKKSERKVLIAGRHRNVIENMIVQLKKEGCSTDVAPTGPDVITKIVTFVPEVIIMDIQMYGISAPELIKLSRKMPKVKKDPIVGYSYFEVAKLGSANIRDEVLNIDSAHAVYMEAGATKYIGRFNERSFIDLISEYL